jgi:hypothetical protein
MLTEGVQWSTKNTVHTIVELPSYLSDAEDLLGSEQMRAVVDAVAGNPEIGQVMQGTGGCRKFRAARAGMGKRGGVRVIYVYRGPEFPIFLITIFGKNEKDNLSNAERNVLKRRVDSLFAGYGAKR